MTACMVVYFKRLLLEVLNFFPCFLQDHIVKTCTGKQSLSFIFKNGPFSTVYMNDMHYITFHSKLVAAN